MKKELRKEIINLQVGDLVRIRDYEEMKNEFGVDYAGDIKCLAYFTEEMKYLCGKEFEVTKIYSRENGKFLVDGLSERRYNISSDMIEVIRTQKDRKFKVKVIISGTTTVVLVKEEGSKKYKKGVAKLHHEDTYDRETGIRIALERALNLYEVKTPYSYSRTQLLDELKERLV